MFDIVLLLVLVVLLLLWSARSRNEVCLCCACYANLFFSMLSPAASPPFEVFAFCVTTIVSTGPQRSKANNSVLHEPNTKYIQQYLYDYLVHKVNHSVRLIEAFLFFAPPPLLL